ncbi:LPS export ABC transporter permease LptF [Methyloversatilis sp.]|jgi:lipopolysaccharide export system permease protein|uniref:LPS export ABC transporter permease LptF n=1 Tax=Methyloversatilis sp. TaxID=2569862 RepID=UPI0027B9156C|nr:LPS export ABC transporter permease LptF [Methyloversatilis sp.]
MLIERYIVREVRRPLLALLGVLTVIFASYTASRYLNEAAGGAMGLGNVLRITGYKVLIALEVLAPVALYVSVVIGLGRLYHDQEMTVMSAAGMPPLRPYVAVGMLALPAAVVVGFLSIYGRPWAYAEAYALEALQTSDLDLSRLQAERFNVNTDTGRMILARQVGAFDGHLHDVLIYSDGRQRNHLIQAREAWLRDADPAHPVLELRDGFSYSLHQNGTRDRTVHFREMTLQMEPMETAPEYKRKAASTAELAASSGLSERAELQWRLSRGPTALLLALLAVPLSRAPPRRGRFANMLPVTAVFALIYYAGGMLKNLIEKGNFPAWPGMWWIPLLMGIALFIVIRRSGRA